MKDTSEVDLEQGLLHRERLLELARETTTAPGVYLMKDSSGGILYVGKAKNLKNRVTTYFQKVPHEIPRIEMLVARVQKFELILTQTEEEALILEATLIKKHKPKYNIRLKDDKAYPYLKLQLHEDFPRLLWTRKVLRDGAQYFGPFPSGFAARQVLDLMNRHFQLRDCSDNTFRHRTRPCILFEMSLCQAPCVGNATREDYRKVLDRVVATLQGEDQHLPKELERRMHEASESEDFEAAALLRDQLQSLRLITAIQVADEAGSHRSRDVISIAREGVLAQACVLQIRGGKILAVRHLQIQNSDPSQSLTEVMSGFLTQYLTSEEGHGDELLLDACLQELGEEVWAGRSLRFASSEHELQLMSVASANAKHALQQAQTQASKQSGMGAAALQKVMEDLHLERLPVRIECFDISNFQGTENVASRVVLIEGQPEKELYRRYKIRTVEGQNDFAMMKEVLSRRFSHLDESLPDLLVVDGGRGQLAQAVAVLDELQIQGVAVVGLAKARTERDFEAQEVASSQERVFIPNRKNPIVLRSHTATYRVLTLARDEAHRFAVGYHRKLRQKRLGKGSH
jgi:excinuclease ABC subunit C